MEDADETLRKERRRERRDSETEAERRERKLRKKEKKRQRREREAAEQEKSNAEIKMMPSDALAAMSCGVEDNVEDGEMRDYSKLTLRPDHDMRPVWVSGDKRILLETFSPIYKQAYDFLVTIAEPVSRPEIVHEYRLTQYALYAAVALGLDSETIISALGRLCKTELPPEVPKFIRDSTNKFGKTRLVLQKGRFLVQTEDKEVLQVLANDREINDARVRNKGKSDLVEVVDEEQELVLAGGEEAVSELATLKALSKVLEDKDEDDEDVRNALQIAGQPQKQKRFEFEVQGEKVENVKRRAIELHYPLMEEYDFRNDMANKTIDLDLKPKAKIRPYQQKSLEKMFGNGRARSGVIVLPCGAGKSLVGVTAACTIKKPTLCLCTSSVSVEQWRHQFGLWSTMPKSQVGKFVASNSGSKDKSFYGGVTVTTYSMLSHSGRRAKESERMLEELKTKEWGLLLLDEVHVVPANVFRKVIGIIKAHCKLGLTATLLREDEKIGDINFLIGPKLYEANWLDLQRENYLATVQCAEVWCPMTKEFYREYLTSSPARRKLLYGMNPNKFRMCQFLVEYHEARGDKVIIFADNIFALMDYAHRLGRPFIHGPTAQQERLRILQNFQNNPKLGTILLSKVGDTSIDIPEANVLIQVSSHYGSRRQEAQRLGRILRPKPRSGDNFNAYFYSLVSTDTQEMFYSQKRQQFLIDQGYAFKVITHLEGMQNAQLHYSTRREQLELLERVLAADESQASETLDNDREERELSQRGVGGGFGTSGTYRRYSSIAELTGAKGVRYNEFNRGSAGAVPKSRQVARHALFRKRAGGGFSKKKANILDEPVDP